MRFFLSAIANGPHPEEPGWARPGGRLEGRTMVMQQPVTASLPAPTFASCHPRTDPEA
jgi:hypothetical protein